MLAITLVIAGGLMLATPAKAFYFEVPQALHNLMQLLVAPTRAEDLTPALPPVAEPPKQPISDGQTQPTCRVDGVEQPGSCDQWNQRTNVQPDQPQQGQMNEKPEQNQPNQQGPNTEDMLKNLKRGTTDVSRQLAKFESVLAKFAKKGVVIPEATKTKVTELKSLIQEYQSVTTMEAMQELDMNDLYDKMRDLEEERQNLEQMSNIMREMGRIESSVKMFEKQVAKLAKKNIPVPAEVADNLAIVKSLIAEIKSGKMDNAQDIFDAIQQLDQTRGQMEMLAQWPQTVKQMDQQIKNLEKELKRDKTIVARLSKKGMDLSSVYAEFEAAINRLKETREAAKAKLSEDASEAFDMVQNDFFGQMDDVWENSRIINTLSNVGQFQINSTREMNQAQQQIKFLKRQKIETNELEDLLAQAKAKLVEIKELFKAKPIDSDSIIEALSGLEGLRQDFGDKVAELTGAGENMPWENAPQQFKQIQVSPNLDKLIPRQAPTPEPTATTTPVPTTEVTQ